MARLRKEKGQSYSQSKTQQSSKQATKTKAQKSDKLTSLSKDHILSLGGNEEDLDLLKNVDTSAVAGSVNEDVSVPEIPKLNSFCG